MLRRSLYAFVMLFCTNVLLSVFESCECKEIPEYCVKVETLTLTPYDNAGAEAKPIENGEVYGKALKLELLVTGTAELCYKPKRSFSLFPQACAFTKDRCEFYFRPDSIIGYDIYSNNNYDAAHSAGSSLKDLFKSDDVQGLDTYEGEDGKVTFYSLQAPEDTGTHILTIMLVQIDGDTIRASTQPLKLLK